jgi:hypothetical protein
MPWIKTGGKALLLDGLNTGIRVAQDDLAGRNAREYFKKHAKKAGQCLLQEAHEHLTGNKSGSGISK